MSKGTITKIDELGRIVIPMDIRKALSIKCNDALEVGIVGNSISIEKNVSIKNYQEVAVSLANIFASCNILLLVTNREEIIYNNTDIETIDVRKLINLSLYELIEEKNKTLNEEKNRIHCVLYCINTMGERTFSNKEFST